MTSPTHSEAPLARNLTALVTAVRWGTTTVGLVWAAALGPDSYVAVVLGVVLLAYCLLRTFRPGRYASGRRMPAVSVVAELALDVAVILSTGCWDSPYIFMLFTPVIITGFVNGFLTSLLFAIAGTLSTEIGAVLLDNHVDVEDIANLTGQLCLLAVVTSYSRHLLSRMDGTRAQRLQTLAQAHQLLVRLNRLSEDLPASFDFRETVDTAMAQVAAVMKTDVTVLLLADSSTQTWSVAYAEGLRLPGSVRMEDLPDVVAKHIGDSKPHPVEELTTEGGLSASARTGVYVPLLGDATRVGMLILESNAERTVSPELLDTLRDLADQAALTIDNARWFEKLRSRGAAQERYRLARDLHDRVGQGVAYVAFELERLAEEPGDISEDLGRLRADAKKIVGELRETLHDLRTEVTADMDLIATARAFGERVTKRSGISVTIEGPKRLNLSISRQKETWRIVQEAMVNAERHAGARSMDIRVSSDQHQTHVVIEDDGEGIADSAADGTEGAGRASYGITGMRERAALLGARLNLSQRSPNGTRVELTVGNMAPDPRMEEMMAGDPIG